MQDLKALSEAVLCGDAKKAREVTQQALAAGVDPLALVNEHMVPAMAEVGRRYECNEYFVPELLISARAMKASLELIRPLLTASGRQPMARVAIGTVKGDLHDIGKNLVVMMLKGAGFEVEDLGVDVPNEVFAAAVERGNQVVCLSALLTTTKPQMMNVIKHLRSAGKEVKVVIGGAVITQDYADKIGADAFGEDAPGAVKAVKRALGMAA